MNALPTRYVIYTPNTLNRRVYEKIDGLFEQKIDPRKYILLFSYNV